MAQMKKPGYSEEFEKDYVMRSESKIPILEYLQKPVREAYEYLTKEYYKYCKVKGLNSDCNNAFPHYVLHVQKQAKQVPIEPKARVELIRFMAAMQTITKANIRVADLFAAAEPCVTFRPIRTEEENVNLKTGDQIVKMTPSEEKEARKANYEQKELKDVTADIVANAEEEKVYDVGGGKDVMMGVLKEQGVLIKPVVISIDKYSEDLELRDMNKVDYSKLGLSSLFVFNQSLYHMQPSVLQHLFDQSRRMLINNIFISRSSNGEMPNSIKGTGYELKITPSLINSPYCYKMSGHIYGRYVSEENIYTPELFHEQGFIMCKYPNADTQLVASHVYFATNHIDVIDYLEEQMPEEVSLKLTPDMVQQPKHKPNIVCANKLASKWKTTIQKMFADCDLYQTVKADGVPMTMFVEDKKLYLRDRKGATFRITLDGTDLVTIRNTSMVLGVELIGYDFVPGKIKIIINSVIKSDEEIEKYSFLDELIAHKDLINRLAQHPFLGNKMYVHTYNSGFQVPHYGTTTQIPFDGVVYVPVLSSSWSPKFAKAHYYIKMYESSDVDFRSMLRWEQEKKIRIMYWNGISISKKNPYTEDVLLNTKDMPCLYEGHHIPADHFFPEEEQVDTFLVTNIRCDKNRYDSSVLQSYKKQEDEEVWTRGWTNFISEEEEIFLNEETVLNIAEKYVFREFMHNLSRGRKIVIYPSNVGLTKGYANTFISQWLVEDKKWMNTGSVTIDWKPLIQLKGEGGYEGIPVNKLLYTLMEMGNDHKVAVMVLNHLCRFSSTEVKTTLETGSFKSYISFKLEALLREKKNKIDWDENEDIEED